MSLIACTSLCIYQQDGYCQLDRALSCGVPGELEPCVHFVPQRHPSPQPQPSCYNCSDTSSTL